MTQRPARLSARILARFTGPEHEPDPPAPVAAVDPEPPPPTEPPAGTLMHEFGTQYSVRVPFDEILRARGYGGLVGQYRRQITCDGPRDSRPGLARQGGYHGDVLFPPE